ncbi:MAG: RNA-directed DNA polymerase [Planctomycetes bacterium]|nr:RNA-directed DNA polymerase [Planctomycetota bacterium]
MVKGKLRLLDVPVYPIKKRFKCLQKFLQKRLRPHPAAHGGVARRSPFTSARRHLGKRIVLTRDIRDCFPSIHADRMFKALRQTGFQADTAKLLTGLFIVHDRLPQGSPLSSEAVNLYMSAADNRLSCIFGRQDVRYTRLVDDLVTAFERDNLIPLVSRTVDCATREASLTISEKKRQRAGLQKKNSRQLVHGLVVNDRRGIGIRPDQARKARELAESFVADARRVTAQMLQPVAAKRAKVTGWMQHLRQAKFSPALHIKRLLDTGDRLVRQRLSRLGICPADGKWWLVVYGQHRRVLRDVPRSLCDRWTRLVTWVRRSGGAQAIRLPCRPV